jgi:Matrixin/IPT/TIG domain/Carboxypeptidase regulatory-like domain
VLRKYGTILLSLLFCVSADAYIRITNSQGQMPKWQSMPVSYSINESGSPVIQNKSEFAAVRAAFQTWQNVPTADIRIDYKGPTPITAVGYDGMNLVTFADSSLPLGTTTIAATFSFYGPVLASDNTIQYGTQEADIAFNPAFDFSTSGDSGKYDIQGVITHEIGHFLGLDHAGLVSSVMVPFSVPSQLDQRTLSYDDMAGVTEIYPKNVPPLGQIQGTVKSGTAPVFGAHVVAMDISGTDVVSTLSQPDGTYTLRFLPAGAYRLYAEPLDYPVSRDNLGGGAAGFYGTTTTSFGTTYFGDVSTLSGAQTVNVAAGGTATANIQVLPPSPTGLNLTRPAFAVRSGRGSSGTLTIGGEDITPGVSFTAAPTNIFLGTLSGTCGITVASNCFGGRISAVASTSAKMDFTVPAGTALGPKNVAVSRGPDVAILSGAMVITDPSPANLSVSPSSDSVNGGRLVTISGTNFRSGAQVFFGGLAASSVTFLNSGTLQATTTANAPGFVNVVVINADGTWGVAPGAFSFTMASPVISNVSPLSGPPGTVLTIQGANFGTLKQNVLVTVAGMTARILSVADSAIQVVVPYGATAGPVLVTVVGLNATGPVFTTISPVASANLATTIYNFKDASLNSGGTPLFFTDPDDSVAFVSLPFTFSLFNDIYVPGERISISTNGWISLTGASDRAFQSSALPATSVQQKSCGPGTGAVPASLIAPFWDDLVLDGTANVSVRVAGSAPNRQFIIEWTNVSIIDQTCTDVHSNLTFEAVLFEGSNDIQFVYSDLSGPSSNGSTAAVGMQDFKRTTGVLASFDQPIVKSRSMVTYSFQNGMYVQKLSSVDLTPPATPLVTDEGPQTSNAAQLAASWTADAPPSGISSFQYAIGTSPGGSDVVPFTSTTQNSAVVTGLSLQTGSTYYFAVKAVSGGGVPSPVGVSNGVRFDPAFQPQIKIIPSSPESNNEFSGLALLAPPAGNAMNVVLRAFDSTGAYILGAGIRNPVRVSLAAGQQYARVLSELFGLQTFDGWIQVEASSAGLGVFTATGTWDLTDLDGSVARDPSTDFVLFHSGASAILVNPTPRTANVALTDLTSGVVQTLTVPPTGRSVITLSGVSSIHSSEALAAIERSASTGRLTINSAEAISSAQSTVVFPHAVTGGRYSSTLTLANVTGTPRDVTISFGGTSMAASLGANGTIRVPIWASATGSPDAVRVSVSALFGAPAALVGVLDIDNGADPVTIGARPASTSFLFPHVANGDGLFTGLAFATGGASATIRVDVYDASGANSHSATVQLGANQQLARLVSEIVAGVDTQLGGYIQVRSDQPIYAWEIYGSDRVFASGPPL